LSFITTNDEKWEEHRKNTSTTFQEKKILLNKLV
jgi:hypothetical protein